MPASGQFVKSQWPAIGQKKTKAPWVQDPHTDLSAGAMASDTCMSLEVEGPEPGPSSSFSLWLLSLVLSLCWPITVVTFLDQGMTSVSFLGKFEDLVAVTSGISEPSEMIIE